MKREYIYCLLLFGIVSIATRCQMPADRNLLGKLDCPETTLESPQNCPDVTLQDVEFIANTARAQPDLRKELSAILPKLLRAQVSRTTLINEARLAGELQLASTVPALGLLLQRPDTQIQTGLTFTMAYLLDDDPIGKALADVGAPALPVLKHLLESNDDKVRMRAARVLILMNTGRSFSVLKYHVSHETDSQLKTYISGNLKRAEELKHEN